MFPTIPLGPAVVPTLPLIYLLGAYVILAMVEWSAKQLRLDHIRLYAVATTALIAGIVGARVAFIVRYLPNYADNLIGIVWPLTAGYIPIVGLFVGIAVLVWQGWWHKLGWAESADSLILAMITSTIVIALADFLGGSGLGTLTNLPWGLTLVDEPRHPVQLYEIITGLVALCVWLYVQPRRAFAGQLALLGVIVLSFGRLITDAFRLDAPLTSGGYHLYQLIALPLLLVAIWWIGRLSMQEGKG